MTRLTKRFSKTDMPDTAELRERILAAVESAIDRVEDVVQDAPSPKEAADMLRRQRVVRSAGTTIVAIAPTVARVARNRHVRRGSKAAPMMLRGHPALLGFGLAASALGGAFMVRRTLRKRSSASTSELQRAHDRYVEDVDPTRFSLEEEVGRMEDEGGGPSAGGVLGSQNRRSVRHIGARAAQS